jgi:hypothetical protein
MTSRLPILLLLLLAFTACPAFAAMQAEPTEFKGIPFGKEYEPDTSFVCQLDSEEGLRCTRPSDELRLHGVHLKGLTYLFMYKRLFTVDMEVDGREAFDALAAELAKRHGKPVKAGGGMLSYVGKEVDILFYYDANRRTGEFSYVFKNLPCPVE